MRIAETELLRWLRKKHPEYYGKIFELRNEVRGWLNYVPQTFPHFTRHTIEHSEAIIYQISNLLFQDGKLARSVAQLSPTEVFIVIAAAYLHDAGMVASDREKTQLLGSDDWSNWKHDDKSIRERLHLIEALRKGNVPKDSDQRNFLADIQLRFLVAEYVRRRHHLRARDVIQHHEVALGRFAYQDPVLREAIAKVCVAHCLDHRELEDVERFPRECDILEEKVNLQFVVLLLRLGDLLDMSHDRACPLLLNAACPLPSDSIAHWNQYTHITHRNTSPKILEITAECLDADEHRVLQDWCQWIIDEVKHASVLAASWNRHKNWRPPQASMGSKNATIQIRPAPFAKYRFCKWRFELDHDVIFERLIKDIYESELDFIRELIQNALDANRVQMYRDLRLNNQATPSSPTKVPTEWRKKYPIKVSLRECQVTNQLSGATEMRHVLSVDDCGIGMDEEVISRYLLQVGRSFYTTEKFRKEYPFMPTSRFGIGFLSTFSVSDRVEVETYKPEGASGPIHLVLTGPRNYLLMEGSRRPTRGTVVSVELNKKLPSGELTALVKHWCRRVEFPIELDELGNYALIERETALDFVKRIDVANLCDDALEYAIRSIPFDREGVEGELYVYTKLTTNGRELWIGGKWALPESLARHPEFVGFEAPGTLICINGIRINVSQYAYGRSYSGPLAATRIDVRIGSIVEPNLSRRQNIIAHELPPVRRAWIDALQAHLRTLDDINDGWRYRQMLADNFDFGLFDFWRLQEDMLPLYFVNGTTSVEVTSLDTALKQQRIWILSGNASQADQANHSPFIATEDWKGLAYIFRRAILTERTFARVERSDQRGVWIESIAKKAVESQADREIDVWDVSPFSRIRVCILSDATVIGTTLESDCIFLNGGHPLVIWLKQIEKKEIGVREEISESLCKIFLDLIERRNCVELQKCIGRWRNSTVLPANLRPPEVTINANSFW